MANVNEGKTGAIPVSSPLTPTGADTSTQVGNVVAYTGDIYDDRLLKNQRKINEEFEDAIEENAKNVQDIQGIPLTEGVKLQHNTAENKTTYEDILMLKDGTLVPLTLALKSEVGTLSSLTTDIKTSIVDAINEIVTKYEKHIKNITLVDNEVEGDTYYDCEDGNRYTKDTTKTIPEGVIAASQVYYCFVSGSLQRYSILADPAVAKPLLPLTEVEYTSFGTVTAISDTSVTFTTTSGTARTFSRDTTKDLEYQGQHYYSWDVSSVITSYALYTKDLATLGVNPIRLNLDSANQTAITAKGQETEVRGVLMKLTFEDDTTTTIATALAPISITGTVADTNVPSATSIANAVSIIYNSVPSEYIKSLSAAEYKEFVTYDGFTYWTQQSLNGSPIDIYVRDSALSTGDKYFWVDYDTTYKVYTAYGVRYNKTATFAPSTFEEDVKLIIDGTNYYVEHTKDVVDYINNDTYICYESNAGECVYVPSTYANEAYSLTYNTDNHVAATPIEGKTGVRLTYIDNEDVEHTINHTLVTADIVGKAPNLKTTAKVIVDAINELVDMGKGHIKQISLIDNEYTDPTAKKDADGNKYIVADTLVLKAQRREASVIGYHKNGGTSVADTYVLYSGKMMKLASMMGAIGTLSSYTSSSAFEVEISGTTYSLVPKAEYNFFTTNTHPMDDDWYCYWDEAQGVYFYVSHPEDSTQLVCRKATGFGVSSQITITDFSEVRGVFIKYTFEDDTTTTLSTALSTISITGTASDTNVTGATSIANAVSILVDRIGVLSELPTSAKTSIVNAIIEIFNKFKGVDVYTQNNEPSPVNDGDMWLVLDAADNVTAIKVYHLASASWETLSLGGNSTYISATEPTSASTGDMWVIE